MWGNGYASEAPEICHSGARESYPWPGCIALEIVEHTKADTLAAVHAMGIAHPDPTLRRADEILRRAVNWANSTTVATDTTSAVRSTLDWTQD